MVTKDDAHKLRRALQFYGRTVSDSEEECIAKYEHLCKRLVKAVLSHKNHKCN